MSRLKEFRSNANLTQAELAELAGASRSLIRNIEQGQMDIERIAAVTLYKLTVVLKCEITDLIDTKTAKAQVCSNLPMLLAKLEMSHTSHVDDGDDYDSKLDYYLSVCTRNDYVEYLMENWDIDKAEEAQLIQEKVIKIIEEKYNEEVSRKKH